MLETISIVVLLLLGFVIGLTAGNQALRSALDREGYALVFRKERKRGQGQWRVYKKTLYEFDGTEYKEHIKADAK